MYTSRIFRRSNAWIIGNSITRRSVQLGTVSSTLHKVTLSSLRQLDDDLVARKEIRMRAQRLDEGGVARAGAWIYLSATLRESRSEGWREDRIMDGVPVMSRAVCRNHAVHTLGCVNQTTCGVALRKRWPESHGSQERRAGKGWMQGTEPSVREPIWEHARNHACAMWLSHTDCLGSAPGAV